MSKGYDTPFDSELSKIDNLFWFPWIGKNYSIENRKILIVAESHYVIEKTKEKTKEVIAKVSNREYQFTREMIYDQWKNNMIDNLFRALVKTNEFEPSQVWDNVAFYNFIQRPMDYTIKERPTKKEFLEGWKTFVEIVKILEPDECLFVGVAASNQFNTAMDFLGFDYDYVKWFKGQGAYARKHSITVNSKKIPITAIKHTSQYFSWPSWHTFLCKNNPRLLQQIYSKLDFQVDDSKNVEEQVKGWVSDIPYWLAHKPIIACDYTSIESGSDARFISVGRAQYDNENAATVKIWRNSGKKWSRQSEEIPISRVSDMFLMLLNAMKESCSGVVKDQNRKSYLQEEVLKEDDLEFLRECINDDKAHLKESLTAIKDLLNSMDLEKM